MMKSFSKFNVIKSKINEGKKSFLDLVLEPKYQYIKIEIPHYDYLRGDVLVSDLQLVNEDCPPIDISALIYLLYTQFLFKIRKGIDLESLSHQIIDKMEEFNIVDTSTKKKQEKLTAVSPNLFMLQEFEILDKRTIPKEPVACITLRIKISEIYRGEVFLHDIYQINPECDFKVEQLIEMLYIDFIKTVKSEGNSEGLFQRIITAFNYYLPYM